jgi:3-methyladenine DNA glycosylase AlkD
MWLRRSALVATVGPQRQPAGGTRRSRPDPADLPAAAAEREDMIEKAVSWALRYLSQKDRAAGRGLHGRARRRVRARVGARCATSWTRLKNPVLSYH